MNDKVGKLRQRLDQEARGQRIAVKPPPLMTDAVRRREPRSEAWPYSLLLIIALCIAFWTVVIWLM